MNENQLQELYAKISDADATYSKRYSFDQFKANMQDQAYVSKLSSWASSRGIDIPTEQQQTTEEQPPVQQRPVANAYNAEELLKKKSIQSVSSSDQSSLEQPSGGDGLEAMNQALAYKPQPAVSEGTRAGVPPLQQQQQVKEKLQLKAQEEEQKKQQLEAQTPEFLKKELGNINKDFFEGKSEEYVVPELNYKFGPLGFKFEESKGTNEVVITAPNKKTQSIPLVYKGGELASSLIKNFISENSVDIKELNSLSSKYKGSQEKFATEKQVEEVTKSTNEELSNIAKKIKDYTLMSDYVNKVFAQLDAVPESERNNDIYKQRYKLAIEKKQELLANAPNLEEERARINSKYNDVQKAAGDYFMMKGEQGTWLGALSNRALKSTGSILAGAVDIGFLATPLSPYMTSQIEMIKGRDEMRRNITNFFVDNFGNKSTTEQWDAATSQSTVKGAILGLGGMIPAMVAGAVAGPAGFMGAFAAEGYNDTMIEAEEAGIPPGERELVAIPVGITMGAIGELGLDKIPGAKVFAKQVTAKALKALGADFTATTFKNFVQNEIKSSIARGAITAGKGFAHGFEMGVKMDVGTNLIKDTYNVIKDKRNENDKYMKVFNTPDSIAEYFTSAVESGISMGIGAAILGAPEALRAAREKNNYNGISDKELALFDILANDDNSMSFITLDIKKQILDGKITKEQGDAQIDSYNKSVSLMRSLPDGLTDAQKRKSLGLLQEKIALKSQIEKSDPALTKKMRERVDVIDKFLEEISDGKYSEVSELKPEEVEVKPGETVQWHTDVTKPLEDWTITEKTDDSVTLTKGEEKQTIPLTELQQHLIDNNAVQKPTTDESVLRAKQPEMELQKVGEGDQKTEVTKKEVDVYRGTTTGNRSEKDGVSYYTPDRGYASFYESGVEKPENTALQELQDLKEPTKPTSDNPISESDLLSIVNELGYKFSSASEIKNRIDELNSKQDKTLKERQELEDLSEYNNYDPIEVDKINKSKQAKYEEELSEYNKKKSELESKVEGYLSPKKLSGNFFSLGIDFSSMSPQQIFEKLKSLGISNEFKGGNFLDNYHSDLVEYARKNNIDFYDGISGGIVGSMNAKPQEIIEVSKISEPTKNEIEDLLDADTSQKDNLKRVYDFLDRIDKNLTEKTKFGAAANEFMRFFPLETLRLVVKGVKVLVEGGMKLRDAIKKVSAENKVSEDDVKSALSYAKEKGDLLELPDYEKTINEIQDYADFSSNRKEYWESKVEDAKRSKDKEREAKAREELKKYREGNFEKAMEILEKSETYKSANDIQRESLVRDLRSRFEIKEIEPPSPEQLFGDVTEVNKIMEELNEFFDDAEKSKTYLEKDYNRKQKDSDENPNSQKLRERAEKAKKELDEYDTKNIGEAITRLRNSRVYQKATSEQKVKMEEYIKDKFLKRQQLRPAELFKQPVDQRTVKMTEMQAIKEQLKNIARGAKSVIEKIKEIRDYVNSVEEYGNLTRKDLRKIRNEMLKVKDEKSLDKAVDKINDIIDNAKTDILEISELKMIKDKLKGIKDAKKDLNEKRKLIAAAIDFIKKSGKINAKKVGDMLNKLGKANIEDDVRIEKIIEYIENVFEDAQYDKKLSDANSLRSKISKLSKSDKTLSNLKVMGEEFAKIDPSMVEDIDKYNQVAEKIKEAMRGGRSVEMVSVEEINKYTKEALKNQDAQVRNRMSEKIKELFGFDPTGMTDEQMADMLKKEKKKMTPEEIAKKREEAVREFESYAAIAKEMVDKGKDPFTGEPIDMGLDNRQKAIVERFLDMDTKRMTDKEMLEAIQVLTNFTTNFSLAKMEKIVENYEGPLKLEELASKGIIAERLRSYYSGALGRLKFGYRANIPAYFERLFKGVTRSLDAREAIGLNNLINQATMAKYLSNMATIEYVNEFIKNNKNFNTVDNATQRGILAKLMRSVNGTPEEIRKDFERRKEVLRQNIEDLSNGSEKEIEKSEIYKKAWDALDIENAKSANDVISKSDKENVRAVKWWINKWAEHRKIMSDVSEGIYNRVLENDINFTPDRYSKFEGEKVDLLESDQSIYHTNNGTLYSQESGSLMEARRPNAEEIKEARRYIDLSFDAVNANAFYDAMVDVYTAPSIQRVMSAINSDAFKKIIRSEKDRKLTQKIIKEYVKDVRNKSTYESSEVTDMVRKLNKLADIGVTMALGGVLQPAKQTVSVASNALITGSVPKIFEMYHNGGIDFMMNSGMGIALRSKESQTSIHTINKMIDLVAQSKGSKSIEALAKANEYLLKIFLEKPDVWIARASWLGYYEKYLKDNGLEHENIDYTKHKMNQKAANYAQAMLDKQQNISDRDLNGLMFKSKNPAVQLVMKAVMPFAGFRLNQATRISNDIATLNSKVSTKEDRTIAARSLVGTSVEMAVFNLAALGISYTIGSITKAIMGQDETEEERQKRFNNLVKGRLTGITTDILSPIPMSDAPVQEAVNAGIDFAQYLADIDEEDRVNIFDAKPADFVKSIGLFGVPIDRANNLYDVSKMYATGQFKDEYGRTKILSESDREAMGTMIALATLAAGGLVPAEVSSIVKQSIKFAEKKAKVQSKLTPEEQKERAENKIERAETKEEKIDAVDILIQQQNDPKVVRELLKIKKDLKDGRDKKERREEKKKMEQLLQGYESKSDMKRYDPDLYERTFGEGTKYYMENRAEMEAEKKLKEYMKEQKDIEYNYSPPPKRRRLRFETKRIMRFRRRGN